MVELASRRPRGCVRSLFPGNGDDFRDDQLESCLPPSAPATEVRRVAPAGLCEAYWRPLSSSYGGANAITTMRRIRCAVGVAEGATISR
jgi:hypothetical protein